MLQVTNLGLRFADRKLFEDVNIKFTNGNCYGLIGANGAGKTTFLKLLSGEIDSQQGHVSLGKGERLAVLRQNHFAYEENRVIDVVMMGHERLWDVMNRKNEIYMKDPFTEEDGIIAAELEGEFAEMDGWTAESDAAQLLEGLGISVEFHDMLMGELDNAIKVKVLLAQALFGNPDVLLLDEPTNGLDISAIKWLEEFLINFENTVIVVSHDRHFLNNICTHICDLDFGKIQLYVGNYDFWYQSSQLARRMAEDNNKKKEEKIKELQEFIARFSANASKSKQATSRKKMLDKITLDDIQPSSRKYPFVGFTPAREIGNDLLMVEGLSKTIDGEVIFENVSFQLKKDDKVAFLSRSDIAITTLFKILTGEMEADSGTFKWGVTTSQAYLPKDMTEEFSNPQLNILEWLRQYAPVEEQDNTFLRSFLGRMLFSGDDVMKQVTVLSGGEKVRCMLSKLMLSKANVLLLDDPTNHLDLESITALNDGLIAFKGSLLFSSHDHEFIQTTANRIIEIGPKGVVDRLESTYDEFLENDEVQARVDALYQ
mgnify:CR=1 FL=1